MDLGILNFSSWNILLQYFKVCLELGHQNWIEAIWDLVFSFSFGSTIYVKIKEVNTLNFFSIFFFGGFMLIPSSLFSLGVYVNLVRVSFSFDHVT